MVSLPSSTMERADLKLPSSPHCVALPQHTEHRWQFYREANRALAFQQWLYPQQNEASEWRRKMQHVITYVVRN